MKRGNKRKGSKNEEAGDDAAPNLEKADEPIEAAAPAADEECANLVPMSANQPRGARKKELKIREKLAA